MIYHINRAGKFKQQLKENQLLLLRELGEFLKAKMDSYTPVDTGYLKSRNSYKIVQNELFLHNDCHYAKYVEFGTYKMKARSFMRRAALENIAVIKTMAYRRLKSGIS